MVRHRQCFTSCVWILNQLVMRQVGRQIAFHANFNHNSFFYGSKDIFDYYELFSVFRESIGEHD